MFSTTTSQASDPRYDAPAERCTQHASRWRRWRCGVRLSFKRTWFIVGRWIEEPIGFAVPLIATLLILLAPQLPDMFAGMADASRQWWQIFVQSLLYAVSAFLLGVFSWFWTRAALAARIKRSDHERNELHPHKDADIHVRKGKSMQVGDITEDVAVTWSRTRAPRTGLFLSTVIAAAPILIISGRFLEAALSSERDFASVSWMGFDILYKVTALNFGSITTQDWKGLLGLPLGFAFYLIFILPFSSFISERRRHAKRTPPHWMWRFSATSIFAAAPFGWLAALALIVLSALAYAIVATQPDLLHWINAPAAALFALAFLIGPLVIAFAVLRDLFAEVLERAVDRYSGWFATVVLLLLSVLGLYLVYFPIAWLPDLSEWLRWPLFMLFCVPSLLLVSPLFARFAPLTARYRYRRTPPIEKVSWSLGLAALLAIAYGPSFTGGSSEHYAIRTTGELFDPDSRPTLQEALEKWYGERKLAGTNVPVVIVTTAGGASRAAVWTLSAMRQLDEETGNAFSHHLFAISSVSGGGLGALTYVQAAVQATARGEQSVDWEHETVKQGLEELAKADLLSAAIATFFLNDTLTAFVTAPLYWLDFRVPDRARALEAAFERHWSRFWLGNGDVQANARSGLIELYARTPNLPHLLVNGTVVDTGQRFITSTIRFTDTDDLFPGSDDFFAYVGKDIPPATAVMNTARFPYISPSGQFWHRNETSSKGEARQLVDGGYFENYGARTAADLASKIRDSNPLKLATGEEITFVPIIVVISNDLEGFSTIAEQKRCRSNAPQAPCSTLDEVTVTCDWLPPPHKYSDGAPRLWKDGSVASETLAPLFGLYATRGAHGRDALHIIRRSHCPGPEASSLYPDELAHIKRMIHMALPRVNPELGEAAPLNWVLNDSVRQFLLVTAPRKPFNQGQARLLKASLQAIRETSSRPARPSNTAAIKPEEAVARIPTSSGSRCASDPPCD